MSNPFALTVVGSALPGKPHAKRYDIQPDGSWEKRGFKPPHLVTRQHVGEFHTIDEAAPELIKIIQHSGCALVSGAPIITDETPLDEKVRRLKHNTTDKATGESYPATLIEQATPFLPIDIDEFVVPGLDVLGNPERAVEAVVTALGPEFEDVSYFWQFTGSQQLTGDQIKLRLFFICDKPHSNDEYKRWALSLQDRAVEVDASIYQAAALILTAPPLLYHDGKLIADPLPKRYGLILGERDFVELGVPDAPTYTDSFTKYEIDIGDLPTELKRSQSALAKIPLDEIPYETKTAFGMALRRAFGGTEYEEAAFEIWANWVGGAHWATPEQLRYRWTTFNVSDDGNIERPATLGSIYYHARQHGWVDPYPQEEPSPAALTPDDKRDFGKDLAILKSVSDKENGPSTAISIINRYANWMPSKLTAADFITNLERNWNGDKALFDKKVRCYVTWLERTKISQAIEPVSCQRFYLDHHDRIIHKTVNDPLAEKSAIISEMVDRGGLHVVPWPIASSKTSIVGHGVMNATDKMALAIAHRQTLCAEMSRVLNTALYKNIRSEHDAEVVQALTCCVDSLISERLASIIDGAKIVFLDEFAQVLRSVATSTTMRQHREVFERLCQIIRDADLVVIADADMNADAIEFAAKCRSDNEPVTVWHYNVPQKLPSIVVTCKDGAHHAIIEAAVTGLNFIVPCDSKRRAQKIVRLVESYALDQKVIEITEETTGELPVQQFMGNANEQCKHYNVVVHSPSIASGVSLTTPHFDQVIALYCGFSLTPSDFIQMIRRDRTVDEIIIGRMEYRFPNLESDRKKIIDGIAAGGELQAKIAGFNNDGQPIFEFPKWTAYDEFRVRVLSSEATAKNGAINSLIYLLEHRGYAVTFDEQAYNNTYKSTAKELHDDWYFDGIKNAADIDSETYQSFKSGAGTTQAQAFEKHRYEYRDTFGFYQDQYPVLPMNCIEMYKKGDFKIAVRNFEYLKNAPEYLLQLDKVDIEGDTPLPASQLKLRAARGALHRKVLVAFNLDPESGAGEMSPQHLDKAWQTLSCERDLLKAMRIINIPEKKPTRHKWALKYLKEKLGLELIETSAGHAGIGGRIYQINNNSWTRMSEILTRREEKIAFLQLVDNKENLVTLNNTTLIQKTVDNVTIKNSVFEGKKSPEESAFKNYVWIGNLGETEQLNL